MRRITTSILTICIVSFPAFSTSAFATVMLDDVLNMSLGSVSNSGADYVTLASSSESSLATILIEYAGFAGSNKMGIYSPADPSQVLQLFNGADHSGDSVTVTFDLTSGQAWIDANYKVNIGSTFGFYLDSTATTCKGGGLFYSDEQLNTWMDKGVEHALIYDTSGIQGAINGNPDVVIAFEDLRINSSNYAYDGDFDDMVIGMSNVAPVPEPATIFLLGMGSLTLAGRGRKLGRMFKA